MIDQYNCFPMPFVFQKPIVYLEFDLNVYHFNGKIEKKITYDQFWLEVHFFKKK